MAAKKISIPRLEKKCDSVSALLRALSHPQRLMILGHLIEGEKTVGELQGLCDASQSQLSQFLERMTLEGLLSHKKRGRYHYYYVADAKVVQLMRAIQTIYC